MKKTKMTAILVLALSLMVWLVGPAEAEPMGTAWTYQGRLMDANEPADGLYDFEFRLFSDPNLNSYQVQVGDVVEINDLDLIDGYFTVELDFGSDVFDGDARWLEISVRPGEGINFFDTLAPRQEVTPVPYSLQTRGIFVDSEGNLGVGTKNPMQKLHVADSGMVSLLVHETDNDVVGQLQADTDYVSLHSAFSHPLRFKINDITRAFIDTDGKVGIGTTTPRASLEVTNTGSSHAIWASTSDIPVYALRTNTYGTWPAVAGDCNSLSGNASGVRGRILSTSPGYLSAGVYGYNYGTGSNGVGVRGYHDGFGAGVYGQCADGKGVYGLTTNGYAGYFVGGKNYFQGKVGIGTTSPQAGLHIEGNGWPNSFMYLEGNPGKDAGIRFYDGASVKWHMFNNAAQDALWIYNSDASHTVFCAEQSSGNVGIGTTSPAAKLHVAGMARVDAVQITGADVAEKFPVSEEVKPGMVVSIDTENQGQLCLSRGAYNRCVAGVVSGANSLPTGAILGNLPGHEDAVPIALNGRAWVYCDSTEKAIDPGDMLTTSLQAGHAMAVTDYTKAHGAVLGKAMTSLEKGQTGLVLTLINLQ
jgi:hypothetical protein